MRSWLLRGQVARRGAQDHQHPARLRAANRGKGGVRVDGGNRHGRAGQQPRQRVPLRAQLSGLRARRQQLVPQLVPHQRGQSGVQRGQTVVRWIAVLRVPEGLVARHGRGARIRSGQAVHHPVAGLHQAIRRPADLGRLLQQVQKPGQHQLGGNLAAAAGKHPLAARFEDFLHAAGAALRGVVLPEHDPRVGIACKLGLHAQRTAVRIHRQHGAGGEVDPQADHVLRAHAGSA